jgi:hypothetical protein
MRPRETGVLKVGPRETEIHLKDQLRRVYVEVCIYNQRQARGVEIHLKVCRRY